MYDIVIIGAGPAGLSAAIYGQRAGKKTLLLDEKGFGGQILNTPEVENYPGIKKVSGFELASTLYEQATGQGAEIAYEKAVAIEDGGSTKIVRTETNTYEAKAVIIATGAKNRPLGLASEAKFTGSGVSYCGKSLSGTQKGYLPGRAGRRKAAFGERQCGICTGQRAV